jgi:hypothetical protein
MNGKQLYLCLMVFQSKSGESPFRFMHAAITSSEEEAKRVAIDEAWRAKPGCANSAPSDFWVYSFRRTILEQAAVEILGWKLPT